MEINYGHITDIKFINFWTNVKKSMILKVQFCSVVTKKLRKYRVVQKLLWLRGTT